jgi:hypothetical protein
MPFYIPKKVVLNWYQYDASFSIELLLSLVEGIENQAADSITNYRTKRTEDGHQGLDEDSFNLEEIFGEYFPSLQRRSAFLTIWGVLEHQLDELCLLYQNEKKFRLSFKDLSGSGLDRSTNYLEKVAGLQGLKASEEWDTLKALQRIRNLIAHCDGKLLDRPASPKSGILADMKKLGFLSGDAEIIVDAGFLFEVVHTCGSYFKRIEKAIQVEQGFTLPAPGEII